MSLPSTLQIAVVDCGAGNLHSVRKAIASQLPEGASLNVVTEAAALTDATHIVLPGVGAFADCMAGLNAIDGMRAALETHVLQQKKPFLGICVGMQMLFERGHEHGSHAGLGWLKGEVKPIAPADSSLRIPHMGWNRLRLVQKRHASPLAGEGWGEGALEFEAPTAPTPHLTSPARGEEPNRIFDGIEDHAFVYFVHSYAATGCVPEEVLATVDYGGEIVSVVGRENIVATQFHPEKSQQVGLRLIRNFLAM